MPNQYSVMSADDFQDAALGSLPPGDAWPKTRDSIFGRFWGAVADLLARSNQDISLVIDQELNPGTSQVLLSDWEAEFGLPDGCVPLGQTVEQRQQALMARITELGSLSRRKYIALAATLGFQITITEYRPSSCMSTCMDPVTGPEWRFTWRVNAPAVTVNALTCNGNCMSPLRWWGNEPLECLIRRSNRPTRNVLFSYG